MYYLELTEVKNIFIFTKTSVSIEVNVSEP